MVGLSPPEIALVAIVSLGICVLATSLAMESAALFVPAFVILFPAVVPGFPAVSGNEAIGLTLLIMFFGQTSTLAGYWYRGQVDVGLASAVLVLAVPAAVVGRVGAYLVPERVLLSAFALLLFGLAAFVAVAHRSGHAPDRDGADAEGSGAVERSAFVFGGLVAGLVGFAIGEVSNTVLHLRRGVPIKRSTGSSTLVLYVTLAAANATNLLVVFLAPAPFAGTVAIPWSIAAIVAPVVVVGGQIGAWCNHRLPAAAVVRLLVVAYVVVGGLTLLRLLV